MFQSDFFKELNLEPPSNPRSDSSYLADKPRTPNNLAFNKDSQDEEPVIAAIQTKNSRQGRRIAGERPGTAQPNKEPLVTTGFGRQITTATENEFAAFNRPTLSTVQEPKRFAMGAGGAGAFRDSEDRSRYEVSAHEKSNFGNFEFDDQERNDSFNMKGNLSMSRDYDQFYAPKANMKAQSGSSAFALAQARPISPDLNQDFYSNSNQPYGRYPEPSKVGFNQNLPYTATSPGLSSPPFPNLPPIPPGPTSNQLHLGVTGPSGFPSGFPPGLPPGLPQPSFVQSKSSMAEAFPGKDEPLTPRRAKLRLLNDELQQAQAEREKALSEAKQRFDEELKQDLDLVEKEHEARMAELKQAFDLKKFSLQSYKEHSEKVISLASMITKQSQMMNILNSKFSKEKEFMDDVKIQELSAKEKALEQRENRLVVQIKSLDQSKANLFHKQGQLQELEHRLQLELEKEKERLEDEQRAMADLKEILKQKDREKKNLLAIEVHKLELLQEHVEREERAIEEEIRNKENEINEKQNLMEQEKNEAYASIQYEKTYLVGQIASLESFRRNLPILDGDLNKRAAACEEKSKMLLSECENLKKAQEMLEKDKTMFDKEAQKIHQICMELDKESEMLMEQKEELDRKKQELDSKRQEVISIKESSRADILRVEQLKASVTQRKRVYESLKTPLKEMDLPRYEPAYEYVEEVQRPVSSYARPRSVASRTSFKATDYLKELEPYNKVRDDIKSYIYSEGNRLLQSRLDHETGLHRSLKTSFHEFSTPASSYLKKHSGSLNSHIVSFARPGDSHLVYSSMTEGRLDGLYRS